MRLIATERVVVRTRQVVRDDLGEPVGSTVTETPADAVVCPGATADMDATRPDGVTVAYTVHLPKGWAFRVVGDPRAYTGENVPGDFSLPVEVTRADG